MAIEEGERSEEDLQLLSQIVRVFFKDQNETEILEITRHLKHEPFKKDDSVFEYGSQGDKLYLIVKGKVAILGPASDQQAVLDMYEKQQG